jgi:hypothetical protein
MARMPPPNETAPSIWSELYRSQCEDKRDAMGVLPVAMTALGVCLLLSLGAAQLASGSPQRRTG